MIISIISESSSLLDGGEIEANKALLAVAKVMPTHSLDAVILKQGIRAYLILLWTVPYEFKQISVPIFEESQPK